MRNNPLNATDPTGYLELHGSSLGLSPNANLMWDSADTYLGWLTITTYGSTWSEVQGSSAAEGPSSDVASYVKALMSSSSVVSPEYVLSQTPAAQAAADDVVAGGLDPDADDGAGSIGGTAGISLSPGKLQLDPGKFAPPAGASKELLVTFANVLALMNQTAGSMIQPSPGSITL